MASEAASPEAGGVVTTYGLFAARIRAGEGFNRRTAFDNIPHSIGVLRGMFRFISMGDLPEPLAWCVDDLAEVLAVADTPGHPRWLLPKG